MKTAVQFAKQTWAGLLVLLAMTVLVGIIYPAVIWGASRIGSNSAEGSPITDSQGCVVGSSLIGIDPQVPVGAPDPYFHNRVTGSISDDNAFAPGDPSAALPTNQGPSSEALAKFIDTRRATIATRENVSPDAVPVDAVTGSGSGIDPDISPAYAAIQIDRVAKVNAMSVEQVEQVVNANTTGRQFGFLGNERVNVAKLNVALGLTAPTCGS